MRPSKMKLLICGAMLMSSYASAISIGWFKVADDAVSDALEDGRVLHIAEAKFNEITSKAKVGDRIDLGGEQYEAVVVVPRQVLTVVDKATRNEMRVLVKSPAKKK